MMAEETRERWHKAEISEWRYRPAGWPYVGLVRKYRVRGGSRSAVTGAVEATDGATVLSAGTPIRDVDLMKERVISSMESVAHRDLRKGQKWEPTELEVYTYVNELNPYVGVVTVNVFGGTVLGAIETQDGKLVKNVVEGVGGKYVTDVLIKVEDALKPFEVT